MTDERRIDRMTGCACLGKGLLGGVSITVLGFACLFFLRDCMMWRPSETGGSMKTRRMIRDIKISIESFKIEYESYPTAAANADDHHLESRGGLIDELCLSDNAKLNFKKIKFIDLPMARGRNDGLWQDGSEWVLSDLWGKPYYIILDTNKDKVIANPEFGADQSNPKYAEKCRNSPPPPTLPAEVIIYSSGPDRDPKTWHDNVCSWRN